MKNLIAALSLFLLALPAHAQQKQASPQTDQQRRMMGCDTQSRMLKGDDRKKFMNECMKGGAPGPEMKKHQERMKDCNRRAAAKGLTGDDRMKFMSACQRGQT